MSTWKATPAEQRGRLARNKLKIAEVDEANQKPVAEIEITSLKIDKDSEPGFDPYNRTGQFCVVPEKEDD